MSNEWNGPMPDSSALDGQTYDHNFRYGCGEHSLGGLYEQTAEVVFSWSDGSDEPAFAWIVRLHDGRFVAVTGWHDYTGWDCRSGMEVVHVGEDAAECSRYLGDDPRRAYEPTPAEWDDCAATVTRSSRKRQRSSSAQRSKQGRR